MNKFWSKIRHPLLAWIASVSLLLTLFLWTMLVHTNGKIDWDYLIYAIYLISILSLISFVVIFLLKVKRWYLSLPLGGCIGLIVAIFYIKIIRGI
jgi:hypothetical protein